MNARGEGIAVKRFKVLAVAVIFLMVQLLGVTSFFETGYAQQDFSKGYSACSEGTVKIAKNNLGNEINIKPSSNHSTTTKNPGLGGKANSSVDILDSNGNIITRRWYGPDSKQIRDVDFTNHGNPKTHPE